MRIEVENLTCDYPIGMFRLRRRRALESVSLCIEKGVALGLLGPNGAGKTTLFRSLLGMIRPTSGTVRIGDFEPGATEWKRLLGYLPEHPADFEYLTVLEFIVGGGLLCGVNRRVVADRAQALLQQMGLASVARQPLRNLSKGTRQRVGLAQALVNEPQILLLDEPMSGLDPHGRRMVRDLLGAARSAGTTIIFSSHNLVDVETLADQVVLLLGGRVAAKGSVAAIVQDPRAGLEIVIDGAGTSLFQQLIQLDPGADLTGNRLQLHLPDDHLLPELVSITRESGGHIVSVGPPRRTLEDWYLASVADRSPT